MSKIMKQKCDKMVMKREKCNLTLKWAHLPVLYTIIGVSGKWLEILSEIWIIF